MVGLFDDDVSASLDAVPAAAPEMSAVPACAAPSATIYRGHAMAVLRQLPSESVQLIVTSPPYWGLRDYKSEPLIWGGTPTCAHEFILAGTISTGRNDEGPTDIARRYEMYGAGREKALTGGNIKTQTKTQTQTCSYCGAWRGSLGLEPTPDLFVGHLVDIFREARRVLRTDGVAFVNIGDSFAGGGPAGGAGKQHTNVGSCDVPALAPAQSGLKAKDLVGIPWMLAFALRADGWHLRADIIWAKGISFCDAYSGSVMPESVTDRPTKGHEYVFLLTKGEDYYWDQAAIRERWTYPAGSMGGKASAARASEGGVNSRPTEAAEYDGTRNVRSVWAIGPRGFDGEFCTACRRFFDGPTKGKICVVRRGISGKNALDSETGHRSGRFGSGPSLEDIDATAERDLRICPCGRSDAWLSHFAVFPEDLVRPMVAVGTSAAGACAACGAPWERVEERTSADGRSAIVASARRMALDAQGEPITGQNNPWRGIEDDFASSKAHDEPKAQRRTVGWRQTCTCGSVNRLTPGIVLDPFTGTGTTAMVALKLGRSFIGAELNHDYAEMAAARIRDDAPLFNAVTIVEVTPT